MPKNSDIVGKVENEGKAKIVGPLRWNFFYENFKHNLRIYMDS